MDNNNNLFVLATLAVLFAFAFIFSFQALAEKNTFYMVLAFVGYGISLVVSLIFGLSLTREGGGLAAMFYIYVGVIAITLIWFTTRVGNAAGWL